MTTPNTPPGWYPAPDGSGAQRFWDGAKWAEEPATAAGATEPPPAAEPASFDYSYSAAADDGRAKLIRNYGIAVAAGLALLLAVVLWGSFNKPEPVKMSSPSGSLTEEIEESIESTDASDSGSGVTEESEAPAADIEAGDAVDANLQFSIDSLESTTNVTSPSNEYLTKDAQGEFIVVYLVVTNVGTEPAFFMANLQKLRVGADTYEADPEASYYLGNIYEEIPPGGQFESALVYDVPPGTVPEALEVHGDAITGGTIVPLQ
jgi:Domain of unknown function (DUF4352)/Protein of unknown function (DUF2510)